MARGLPASRLSRFSILLLLFFFLTPGRALPLFVLVFFGASCISSADKRCPQPVLSFSFRLSDRAASVGCTAAKSSEARPHEYVGRPSALLAPPSLSVLNFSCRRFSCFAAAAALPPRAQS